MVKHASLCFPPALVPGDWVAVVAPSGPLPRDEFLCGLAWLRQRYRIVMKPSIFSRDEATGTLAGSDERRRDELTRAMLNGDVRAIVAARGGYGATRIAADLPWNEFAKAPKWLAGFSDITALHGHAWGVGIASIHGANVTGLARAHAADRATWLAAIERPQAKREWCGLRVMHGGGAASGVLVGGNLSILAAMAAAGELKIPDSAILAIEDVGEAPYRVDRKMTSLLRGGYLNRVCAIVFGEFDQCTGRPGEASIEQVLNERTSALGVPVLSGAPFGHGLRNEAWISGAWATVDGNRLSTL